ncbi:MAG: TOBE domain-containing protein [Bacteroidota bacterium]
MNRFPGTIKEIKTSGSLSLLKIEVKYILFTTVIIDTPETLPLLKVGYQVHVIFKESEVVIGKEPLLLSQQNRIPGKIKSIEEGKILSKVLVETDLGAVTALITTNAVSSLQLSKDDEVVALVKTNEIMLSYD